MVTSNVSEKEISGIWQNCLLGRDHLATRDGIPIKVISPGRANDDKGPDFRGAVIAMANRLMKGDIELHVRTSDWQAHGHHLDAAYNRVMLHLVFQDDLNLPVRSQNGREIPTLALEEYLDTHVEIPGSVLTNCSVGHGCASVNRDISQAGELLDRAGDERFLIKSHQFNQDLSRLWANQVLYRGVMGALGYSRNKLPFLELARRLPLRILQESGTHNKSTDASWLLQRQALLLGTAGLLPLLRQNDCYRKICDSERLAELERLWGMSHATGAMSLDDWHLKPVRPNNSPVFRLLALSYLLLRYREKGWLEGLINLIEEAPTGQGSHKHLEEGLEIIIDDLPSRGYGLESINKITLSLLGRQRAADIAVNVLLPFSHAWSEATSRPELGEKAFALYRNYPGLASNSIEERLVQRLGIERKLVNSARRQQGLLHIFHSFCETGRCGECQFKEKHLSTTN